MKFSDKSTTSIAEAVKLVLEGKNVKKEEMDPTDHVSKKDGKYIVVDKDGKEVKSFDDLDDANKYAVDNHSKLMGKVEESADLEEMQMSDIEKKLAKVKGLSKETMAQLTSLPMPVLTSMVNQLSTIMASCKEEADINEALLDFMVEAKKYKLSRKEEASILLLLTKSKTDKEAANKLEKEMKVSAKDAAAMIKQVMSQYESAEPVVESAVISEEDKQAKYQAFFKKAMKKFGISNIADLKGEKKKEFFDYVDANYEAEGEVDEVAEPEAEGEKKFKALHKVKVSEESDEDALDEAGPTWIDGVKYQKLKKKKGFNKADWEWNSSKQLYKRVNEEVTLDEAFKRIPGNMINGELPRAAKDLQSVIRGLKAGNDFDDKAFNKVLADLNNVKKSAKSFKSEDDVTRPYQYRADPRYKVNEEVTLEEAFNIEKGALVKMKAGSDKDLYGKVIKQIKVNGKPGVTVQWKNGVKGNFRMDQFAAVSMDRKADYQVQESVTLEERASDKIAKQMVVLNTKIDRIRADIDSTEDAYRDNNIDKAKFKKLDNEHNKRLSKAEADLDKLFAKFKSVKESIDLDELHAQAIVVEELDAFHGQAIAAELLEAVPSTVVAFEAPFAIFTKEAGSFFFNLPTKYKVAKVADSSDRHVAIAGEPKNLEKMLKDPIFDGKLDVEAIMKDAVKFTGKERFPREKGKNFKN